MARNPRVTRTRALLAVTVTVAGLAVIACFAAPPADAGLGIACPDPSAQVFRPWADYAYYVAVPDNGFEAGASGWSLAGGAKVVSGNEPFYVRSSADRSSLRLPAGASATSPPTCIALLSSKMRFVVNGQAGSAVKVQIVYRGLLSNVLGVFDGGTVRPNGRWAPSPELSMLGGVLPLLTQSVQFRFVASGGTVELDDVYLDPWKIG